ncbi:hypothetical protein FHS77_002620 [Paenochrobactrum gallinarii]|uniref:Uncharacterized protein n=1 Tax=Paenochrobactrum gallinarii TaxID=643673 RepID=A0A841LZW0_9HYPH|nr:hypothetical protein [Paenochrobactrum gallinarii]MBB6262052.1 hypothetical protein [Paenochrobactrum gallinarii]
MTTAKHFSAQRIFPCHMVADGTGDITGVIAPSLVKGDVNITFSGPCDSGNINEISEKTNKLS